MSIQTDFEFDLESILAEFSSDGAVAAAAPASEPAKRPQAEKPSQAAPRGATAVRPRARAAAEPGHSAQPKPPAAPPSVEEPTVLRPAPRKSERPKAPERPAKPEAPERPARQRRKTAAEKEEASILPVISEEWRRARRGIAIVFALLSALCLCWICLNVHPDTPASARESREDLSARLEQFNAASFSQMLGDPEAVSRFFTLSDSAAAPRPDPACYGSTTDTGEVQAVIERAAGLLDGETLAWDPGAVFLPGSEFRYYLDDSLFVLCWKEILDGKCCSCAEVRIADGSQLRRKLAEDSYGSSVQLYATQMAREANAVVAINGDFYAFRNLGVTVYQRQLYRCNPGSVDTCFFTGSGDMVFAYAGQLKGESEVRQFIEDNDVRFSVAFGPVLVDNGQLRSVTSYPVGEIDHYYSRSSIGMLGERHYLLMTVNYEGDYQHTCTTAQSGEFMLRKGCWKAYSLDGGQTSIIVLDGRAFNRVDWDSERSMSDLIYFATAVRSEEVTP